jgi:hypothetical protein
VGLSKSQPLVITRRSRREEERGLQLLRGLRETERHKENSFLLPRIDYTLDTLAGAKLFSTLDRKSDYWQVGLHPDDKEKTTFSTSQRLWKFTIMPFGLCNAPAKFERLMEIILRGLTSHVSCT